MVVLIGFARDQEYFRVLPRNEEKGLADRAAHMSANGKTFILPTRLEKKRDDSVV